jgi:Mg-chelatase subunit ChlD
VALLVDTSGSMTQSVRDFDGARRPKLDIAKRAGKKVIAKLKDFADTHPGRPLKLGLYEFSGSACRRLGPFDLLDQDRAVKDLEKLTTRSGTPIGEAMIAGKHDLDRSGLTKKHLVLLTDGVNTTSRNPQSVAKAMASLPPEEQAGVYFIAFDVEASRFSGIKEAGGTVLEASSAPELDRCLDYILEQKILLELPEVPARK